MELVVGPFVREHVEARGGAVYVWPERVGCCRPTRLLEAATDAPAREFELLHATDGLRVFGTPGLVEPDELHLELSRRGKLRAFWNGQSWVG